MKLSDRRNLVQPPISSHGAGGTIMPDRRHLLSAQRRGNNNNQNTNINNQNSSSGSQRGGTTALPNPPTALPTPTALPNPTATATMALEPIAAESSRWHHPPRHHAVQQQQQYHQLRDEEAEEEEAEVPTGDCAQRQQDDQRHSASPHLHNNHKHHHHHHHHHHHNHRCSQQQQQVPQESFESIALEDAMRDAGGGMEHIPAGTTMMARGPMAGTAQFQQPNANAPMPATAQFQQPHSSANANADANDPLSTALMSVFQHHSSPPYSHPPPLPPRPIVDPMLPTPPPPPPPLLPSTPPMPSQLIALMPMGTKRTTTAAGVGTADPAPFAASSIDVDVPVVLEEEEENEREEDRREWAVPMPMELDDFPALSNGRRQLPMAPDPGGGDGPRDCDGILSSKGAGANANANKHLQFASNVPPLPPEKLPHPDETPTTEIPPEMEQETRNWRQYAIAAFKSSQGRNGAVVAAFRNGRYKSREEQDEEEEQEEQERQRQQEAEELMGEEEEDGWRDDADDELFRGRRSTVTYRFPTEEQQKRNNHGGAVARKWSMGHQRYSTDERWRSGSSRMAAAADDEEEQLRQALGDEQMRRLSLTERNSSLLSANYAILRKSVDRFEVVGSFHRCHSEAYRNFLQSLTCYDLSPQHGLMAMLDEELTIQKAVQISVAHPAPRIAVISNCRDSQRSMFTVTDCLLALHRAHTGRDAELGSRSLRHFVEKVQSGRRLISVDDQSSVWDLVRVFTLNRVHRVPVFCAETTELSAILCPRAVCLEVLKLLDSKCALQPNLNVIPLSAKQFGTWGGPDVIASLREGQNCAHAINIFLEKQVSALPVLDAKTGHLLGVLDKNDLLDGLFDRLDSKPTLAYCFQLMEEIPVEHLLPSTRRRTVNATISIADAMRALTEDGLCESMFVVEPAKRIGDPPGDQLCGVISHTDILAYILSCEQRAATSSIAYTVDPAAAGAFSARVGAAAAMPRSPAKAAMKPPTKPTSYL